MPILPNIRWFCRITETQNLYRNTFGRKFGPKPISVTHCLGQCGHWKMKEPVLLLESRPNKRRRAARRILGPGRNIMYKCRAAVLSATLPGHLEVRSIIDSCHQILLGEYWWTKVYFEVWTREMDFLTTNKTGYALRRPFKGVIFLKLIFYIYQIKVDLNIAQVPF